MVGRIRKGALDSIENHYGALGYESIYVDPETTRTDEIWNLT